MTFRQVLTGAFIAVVAAAIIRMLLPVPVTTGFAILMFFFMLQLVETRFGVGIGVAKRWATTALRIAGALVIFIALRFLVGQWLRIYPTDTHQMWGNAGGIKGLFWGHAAEQALVWELLFAFVAGGLVYLWSRGRARKLVAMAFVGSLIIVTGQLVFPMYAATWPNRYDIDQALTQNGGITGLAKKAAADMAVASEEGARRARGEQRIEVELQPDRWSDKVVPPMGVGFTFVGPLDAQVRFEDGTEGPITKDYGVREDWLKGFRFRGPAGEKVTVAMIPRR